MERLGPFTFQQRVRFDDVDHAGIVYHPRFFHFFHQAFEELFFARGSRGDDSYRHLLDDRRVGLPAVRVECDFHRPVRFGDRVDVEMSLERIGTRSLAIRYRVLRPGAPQDGPHATGRVVYVVVDLNTFRPIQLPDDLRELFASLASPASC